MSCGERANSTNPSLVASSAHAYANEADPDRQARLKQTAQQLNEIHAAIKAEAAVNLTPSQIKAYNRAWDTLETIRREKAMSLHDAAMPIVEEPTATEPAAEERYAIAS